jgi:hypothetical protein
MSKIGVTDGTSRLGDLVSVLYVIDIVHLVSFVQPNKPDKLINSLLLTANLLSLLREQIIFSVSPALGMTTFPTPSL